ncbi:MAG: hypothetical protein IPL84_00545 [Chitinophagaceae bacterium]|nr:hypothetical protein [Chitinophagaceae bacterium]
MKRDNIPAKVRIFISGKKYALKPDEYSDFLDGLTPHLQSKNNGIIPTELPDFNSPMPYILFEDFNTKGLEGDPIEFEYNDYTDQSKAHNFYFFWRAYGRSGKLAGKMGSWGVGKSVFPALSKINSFWTVTIRESDKKAYLIGQSVLRTHDRIDKPAKCAYFPYGYFGKFAPEDQFALPEDDLGQIEKFSKAFLLKRNVEVENRDSNTGVSIIIPFAKEEVSINTVAYATMEQFFYPILLGKLEVEVREEENVVLLTKEKILNSIEKIDFGKVPNIKENVKSIFLSSFEFTKWIISLKGKDYYQLNFPNPSTAYEWRKQEMFKDLDIADLQEKFENGTPLAFNIPVKFQPEGEQCGLRYFKAYIQKDERLLEPENFFIREYLTITGIKSLKKKGVRGMVIIDDKDLVTFFGHAEGPAHTGWHKDNFKVKYESTDKCISFVKNSLERLYNILIIPAQGIDKNLLKDFFYVDIEEDNDKGTNNSKPGKKKENPPDDFPPRSPKKYILTQTLDGFKVTGNSELEIMPEEVRIKLAYDSMDGNPFKNYSEHDFDLKKLKISSSNINISKREMNVIEFKPVVNNFSILVTGFDTKRDLIIDVK